MSRSHPSSAAGAGTGAGAAGTTGSAAGGNAASRGAGTDGSPWAAPLATPDPDVGWCGGSGTRAAVFGGGRLARPPAGGYGRPELPPSILIVTLGGFSAGGIFA